MPPPLFFARDTALVAGHPNTETARRRLLGVRLDGHRAFGVGDLVEGLEDVVALVVAPVVDGADLDGAARAANGEHARKPCYRASEAQVLLLELPGAGTLCGAVCVRKVHLASGLTFFYASAVEGERARASPAWALGLDERLYRRLQAEVARVLGYALRREWGGAGR